MIESHWSSECYSIVLWNGSQDVVLLFHGITGNPDEMLTLAEFLNKSGYSTLVPFLAGHQSIESLKRTSHNTWLQEAEALFESALLRKSRVHIVGMSFGALLALHLAQSRPNAIKTITLIAPPIRFKSGFHEVLLRLLSFMPDTILNSLWVIPKKDRGDDIFAFARKAFAVHSVGAVARLVKIRRHLMDKIHKIAIPMLVLQDPYDHLVSSQVPQLIAALAQHTNVDVRWFPHGQHELTIGKLYQDVNQAIKDFIVQHSTD